MEKKLTARNKPTVGLGLDGWTRAKEIQTAMAEKADRSIRQKNERKQYRERKQNEV